MRLAGTRRVHILPFLAVSALALLVFSVPLERLDELWNFNFARCIARGYIPYQDFNMLQTPLSAYISAGFLLLFGGGLFAYRIAGFCLITAIFYSFYLLGFHICRSRALALVGAAFTMLPQINWFLYDYNYLTSFCAFLIVLNERRVSRSGRSCLRYPLCSGLLFGLAPLIKQNTGLFFLAANLLIGILDATVFHRDRKAAFVRIAAGFAPSFVFLLVLCLSGRFAPFLDYAVYGVTTFGHRTSVLDFISDSGLFALLLLIPAGIHIYVLYRFIRGTRDRNLVVHEVVALAMMTVVYPLCDAVHLLCGMTATIPLCYYFIDTGRLSAREIRACGATGIAVCLISAVGFLLSLGGCRLSGLKHYAGIPIRPSLEAQIQTIDEYILARETEGRTVYMACDAAAAYMIPLDQYRKNWDMLLIGNLGSTTISQLLDVEPDSLFLLYHDDGSLGWQSHFDLVRYIRENYEYADEVLAFDVYTGKSAAD